MDRPVGIITGGLSGIGAASAIEFAALGARILLVDQSRTDSSAVERRVREAGGEAVLVAADVRDAEAMRGVAEHALETWGHVDFLLANAGVAEQSRVATGDPARWRAVIETNLLGLAFSCRAVLPAMLERGRGHVFVMSSVSGRESYVGEPVYIASKWGQVGFAHALRLELLDASSSVRITIVEPGLVDTPLTRGNPKVAPLLDDQEPLAPEDVARAIVYAFRQPDHVVISELTLRPVGQRSPRL